MAFRPVCASSRRYVCCPLYRPQVPDRRSTISASDPHTAPFHALPGGITCIDADYVAPGTACFYLVGDAGEYALIETGTNHSLGNLRRALDHLGIVDQQIRYVVPTHVHLDHAGAAGLYLREFPGATLLVHPRGARHLTDPARLVASSIKVYGEETFAALYGEIIPAPVARTHVLEDGETFTIGQRTLGAMHTRGHAEHHLCLWDEQTGGWFSGDMFGISYAGLRFEAGSFVLPATTPTQFDPQAYIASVHALAARNPAMMYLTHFSALPFRAEQVDMLCDQLQHYTLLGSGAGQDVAALQTAVIRRAEQHLQRLTSAPAARTAAQSLVMDAQLNAQGIAFRQSRIDNSHSGAETA